MSKLNENIYRPIRRKYDEDSGPKCWDDIHEMYPKIRLDGAWQRWGGVTRFSGWPYTDSRDYIYNAMEGCAFNYIMLANVKYCLQWAREVGCEISIEYFEECEEKGYDYVSIDGNNTTSTIYHYLESHPEIYIKEGKKKIYFKDLDVKAQMKLRYTEETNVIILRRITVPEMCDLFRKLNKATKLNDQEYRQARWTELSKIIREAANLDSVRDMFVYFAFGTHDMLDRRGHEEFLAQVSMKLEKAYDATILKKKGLDDFYENNSNLSQKTIKDVDTILNEVVNLFQSLKATDKEVLTIKLGKGTLHNLFDLVQIVVIEENYEIKDYLEFANWFLDKNAEFDVASGQVTEEEQEEKSYNYWTKFFSKKEFYLKIRNLFRFSFNEDVSDLLNDDIVAQKPNKTYFNRSEKLEMYVRQGGLDRDGNEIKVYEIYTGALEADHVKSQKEGGKTEISNGELMAKEANRSKGSDSNEPHFDFQFKEQQELDLAS